MCHILLKEKVSENKVLLNTASSEIILFEERIKMQKEYIKKITVQQDEVIQEKKEQIKRITNTNGILDVNLSDEEEKLFKLRKEVAEEEYEGTASNGWKGGLQ